MNRYLYHLTTLEALPAIFKNGIEPRIGARSLCAGESQPSVYLCERKDIPYWRIILGVTTALKIDTSLLNTTKIHKFSYDTYNEYIYNDIIPTQVISRTSTVAPTASNKITLCESYIITISELVLATVKYYEKAAGKQENQYHEQKEWLEHRYDATLYALNNLNYNIMTTKMKRNFLKQYGDSGEYTFLDTFKNTPNKLYQQMANYEPDDLTNKIMKLKTFIETSFTDCLDLNTGGWTG